MSPDSIQFPERPSRGVRRYRVHGLAASTVVHIAAVSGLLLATIRPWYFESWAAREARVLVVTTADQPTDEAPEVEVPVVADPSDVTGPMLQDKIDEIADESRQRPDEENLQQLDRLADRLKEVSSEESIDRMAQAFQALLGTKPRADQPSDEPVAGDFDFDTAQFHDVRREEEGDGGWRYLCILIDAEGRVLEGEMDADEGERVYQTMLRIKQNPLLERVYRQIAMPLFDKMLAGARQAANRRSTATGDSPKEPDAR